MSTATLALPSRGGGGGSPWLILIPLLFFSVAMSWPRLLRRWRLSNTAGWPESEGVVESADWDYGRGKQASTPVAEVSYCYQVEGERFSGYWRLGFRSSTQATDFVNETRGRKLELRYKKAKPEKSFVVKVI
jgi:Protein of unknown function (DUF3592)